MFVSINMIRLCPSEQCKQASQMEYPIGIRKSLSDNTNYQTSKSLAKNDSVYVNKKGRVLLLVMGYTGVQK